MTLPISFNKKSLVSAFPPLVDRREIPALILILLITGIIASSLSAGVVTYNGDLDDVLGFLVILYISAFFAEACKITILSQLIKMSFAILAMGLVTPLASAALAPLSRELCDNVLSQADNYIFDQRLWPAMVDQFRYYHQTIRILSYAYASITWQPFLFIVICCSLKSYYNAWRCISAWGMGLVFCLIIFPFCPALGAYAYFHIAPSDVPDVIVKSAWHYPVALQKFRSGEFRALDANALEGIVAMPSFHACSSIILAWEFSKIKWVALIMVPLNIMMWISSVPIGGHYAVDVLMGSVVAVVVIYFSKCMYNYKSIER